MNTSRVVTIVACAIALSGRATAAQSLADVVRKDVERRGQVEGGRTYTNADLATERTPAPVANAPVSPQSATRNPAPSSSSPATGKDADAVTTAHDMPADEYWRTQALELTARVADARSRVAVLARRLSDMNDQQKSPALAREQTLTARTLDGARRDLESLTAALRNLEHMAKTRPRR